MKREYSDSVMDGLQIAIFVFFILMILKLFGIVEDLPGWLPVPLFYVLTAITIGLIIPFISLIWFNWKKIKEDVEHIKEQTNLMLKMFEIQSTNMEKSLKIHESLSKLEALLSKEKVKQ